MSKSSLLKVVKEEADARLWSKAVELTRIAEIVIESQSESEVVLRILVKGRPVSPTVTLWPQEDGWSCDCDEDNDPCIHVAAAAIAANAGSAKRAEESSIFASLSYEFKRDCGALIFTRQIDDGKRKFELKEPLARYLGGVNSGRINGPLVSANRIDLALDSILDGKTSGRLDNRTLHRLFSVLAPFTNVYLDGSPVRTSGEPVRLAAEVTPEKGGFRLSVSHAHYTGERFLNGAVLVGNELRAVLADELTPEDIQVLGEGGTWFGRSDVGKLASEVLPNLSGRIHVSLPPDFPKQRDIRPRVTFQVEPLGPDLIAVTPRLVYGDPPLAEVGPDGFQLLSARVAPIRKPDQERELIQSLRSDFNLRLGLPVKFEGEEGARFLHRLQHDQFFGKGVEERAIRGELAPQFVPGAESFALNFAVPGGKDSVPGTAVLNAWREGREYLPLMDGSYAQLPLDWLERFGPRVEEFIRATEAKGDLPGHLRPAAAALFEELSLEPPEFLSMLRARLERLESLPPAVLPSDLRAELRPYQLDGLNWLSFVRNIDCGALLADDMGLGKTLQALCVIQGRTLVVAPTSVLPGWMDQIELFRPGLRASLYHGPARRLDLQADVTVTSYGILRSDQEDLSALDWDNVILDEAQTIKNPQSQAAQAAFRLPAHFRIALTGTPVENRLSDIWSEFNFLNPGLVGSEREFTDRYERAIRRGDPGAAEELRARIRPFILRRKKSVVAKDLPSRTETVLYCELNGDEQDLYEALLAAVRKEVIAQLNQGKGIFTALEALLRLRQACCHPALLPGHEASTSSKLEVFLENLEEALSEGHKALVFSQWTSMLDLVEPHLEGREVGYLRLDGSTSNREQVVSAFQADGGPPIMLMSLKAGGVGLTLTAADHVFLLDPWWNPAAEDQAADRAHRIGQTNPVLIQRLVAKNTIEERVLKLQAEKRRLAEAVLEDGSVSGGLTKEDLLELLS